MAATASDDVLAQLGSGSGASEKTFRAVLSRLDPADLNARMGSYFTAHVASSDPSGWCRSRWTARCCVVLYAPKRQPRISCRCSPTVPDWCSVNSLSPRKAMKFLRTCPAHAAAG
ncbi:transposase family protein [Mycobacterium ulcerans str. Harvey]|uniref:Transposase family protein n=1 Tax=Mycobacterium ulcerans str. Harvey TaxID=1299332 RepID=A0ABP3AUH3_MYCUL|nr:transposase family protein [Mycobacterium ulcerans str. Harvey]